MGGHSGADRLPRRGALGRAEPALAQPAAQPAPTHGGPLLGLGPGRCTCQHGPGWRGRLGQLGVGRHLVSAWRRTGQRHGLARPTGGPATALAAQPRANESHPPQLGPGSAGLCGDGAGGRIRPGQALAGGPLQRPGALIGPAHRADGIGQRGRVVRQHCRTRQCRTSPTGAQPGRANRLAQCDGRDGQRPGRGQQRLGPDARGCGFWGGAGGFVWLVQPRAHAPTQPPSPGAVAGPRRQLHPGPQLRPVL